MKKHPGRTSASPFVVKKCATVISIDGNKANVTAYFSKPRQLLYRTAESLHLDTATQNLDTQLNFLGDVRTQFQDCEKKTNPKW